MNKIIYLFGSLFKTFVFLGVLSGWFSLRILTYPDRVTIFVSTKNDWSIEISIKPETYSSPLLESFLEFIPHRVKKTSEVDKEGFYERKKNSKSLPVKDIRKGLQYLLSR